MFRRVEMFAWQRIACGAVFCLGLILCPAALGAIYTVGPVVFVLAVAAYEFVRPKLAKLKWDMPDDEDDDGLFYARIMAMIVIACLVLACLVISVLIMIGA